jgi:hypothetical protein
MHYSRCPVLLAACIPLKHQSRVKTLESDNHSSLSITTKKVFLRGSLITESSEYILRLLSGSTEADQCQRYKTFLYVTDAPDK